MGSRFDYILKKLLRAVPEIKAAAIVSAKGLPISSALPQGVDETKFAAMTAALVLLSEKAIIEMRKGDFHQVYVKGTEGYLLVMQVGPDMVLMLSTTKDVRIGLILLECERVCEKISDILDGSFDDDDEDDDRYPYPYIFKPPEPPDDFEIAPQLQVYKFMDKELENEKVCPFCGMELTEEEGITHNCRKNPS